MHITLVLTLFSLVNYASMLYFLDIYVHHTVKYGYAKFQLFQKILL